MSDHSRLLVTALGIAALGLAAATIAAQQPVAAPESAKVAGTRLTYVPDSLEAKPEGAAGRSQGSHAAFVDAAVATIRRRLEDGPARATVRPDKSRVCVDVETCDRETIRRLRSRIENPGRLELRMVAYGDYAPIQFDLEKEKQRLEAWVGDPANSALVEQDPVKAIESFNRLPADQGGPLAGQANLRWAPMKRRPAGGGTSAWMYERHPDAFPNGHEPTTPKFLPLNCHEIGFTTADLDPQAIHAMKDREGQAAIGFALTPERRKAYFELSGRNKDKAHAIVLNGEVVLAPFFRSAIPGVGAISGGFLETEVEDILAVLKSGPLPAKLLFVSVENVEVEPTPAAKGERRPDKR